MMKTKLTLLMAIIMIIGTQQICVAKKKASPISVGCIASGTGDVDATFRNLQEMGFTSCQIGFPGNYTQETIDKLDAARQKYGIKITTVITVPGRCVWNFTEGPSTIGLVPTEGREQKLEAYRKCIDFCQKAGIPAMHSHFGFIPEDPSSAQYKEFIAVMKALATYAKERGVDIYFESCAGRVQVIKDGMYAVYSEEEATKILSQEYVTAVCDMKNGSETATAWGCDLTYDYVKINGDYRS